MLENVQLPILQSGYRASTKTRRTVNALKVEDANKIGDMNKRYDRRWEMKLPFRTARYFTVTET